MVVVNNLKALLALQLQSTSVVTIGTFDGVHSGHRLLINKTILEAKNHNQNSIVITFDKHPREFLNNTDHSLQILTSIREKIKLIEGLKPDFLVVLPFAEIFNLSPESFIQQFLHKTLKMRRIIVGDDFHFGKHRLGNISLLRELTVKLMFEVEVLERIKNSSDFISSSLIRQLLSNSKISSANAILGYPYLIMGIVCESNEKITQITLKDQHKLIPKIGLYEVKINNSELAQTTELIKVEIKDNWQVLTFKNYIPNLELGQEIQLQFVS